MGLRSPPIAQALRRFDPYPRDILALDFAGVATGGRQLYKREGIIVPRFEMLRGAASAGHAGFGRAEVNGAWRAFAPDAPLIGDGGLGVWEARTNSIRNPVMAGASVGTPGSLPTTWGIAGSSTVGVAFWVTGAGEVDGLPYIDLRFFGTPSASATYGIQCDQPTGNAVASAGQTWTTSGFLAIVAGSVENVASVVYRIRTFNAAAAALEASAFEDFKGLGPALEPVSASLHTSDANTAWVTNQLLVNFTIGLPIDITIRIAAPNLKLGPDINDPPILQETGLPATRPAVAQSVGGLSPPSGDWRMQGSVELLGDTNQTQRFVDWNDGTDDNKVVVERTNTGGVLFTSRRAAVSTGVGTFNAKTGARIVEWSLEKIGANLIATCDGVAAAPVAVTPPANMTATQLGAFRGGSGGWLNGHLRNLSLRYG